MYELTCPFCRQAIRSPYVRTDAIATCPRCHERYQIKTEHIRRTHPSGAEPSTAGLDSLAHTPLDTLVGSETGSGISHAHNAAGPSVVTPSPADTAGTRRSGIGNAVKPPATGGANSTGSVISPSTASPSANARARTASAVAQQKAATTNAAGGVATKNYNVRLMYVLPVAVLVLVAFYFAWRWSRPLGDVAKPANVDPSTPPAPVIVDLDPRIPMLVSERLVKATWRNLEDQEVWTAGDKKLVRATEATWSYVDSTRIFYNTQLYSGWAVPLVNVKLQYCLLDGHDKGMSIVEYPTVVLFPDEAQTINLQVPVELWEKHVGIDWKVVADGSQQNWTRIEAMMIQPVGKRQSTMLHVVLRNRSLLNVKEIVILVIATDKEGQTLARWRAKSPKPLGDGLTLEVAIPTPLENALTPANWHATAAGLVDMNNPVEKNYATTKPALP